MATDEKTEGFKKANTEETKYGTGAQRDGRAGKGAFKWMPPTALFLVSRIYENGNLQRGIRNWEKGMALEDFLDSAERHIQKHKAGFRDEAHISQAIWNLLNFLQTSVWVMQGQRPAELHNLADHITGLEMGQIPPLSPMEVEWLKTWGIDLTKKAEPEKPHTKFVVEEGD